MQVYSLTEQNKLLGEKLLYTEKKDYTTIQNSKDGDNKELTFSKNDLIHSNCMNTCEGSESLAQSIQAGTLLDLFHSLQLVDNQIFI